MKYRGVWAFLFAAGACSDEPLAEPRVPYDPAPPVGEVAPGGGTGESSSETASSPFGANGSVDPTAPSEGDEADDPDEATDPTAPAKTAKPAKPAKPATPSKPSSVPKPLSAERSVLAKLGLPARFAIGVGNDAPGSDENGADTYKLGTKLDLHYMYLSNLDWPEWNQPEGAYVTRHAAAASQRGIVPMFTLYQAAAWQENNLGAFATDDFMRQYWRGVRVMFNRLAETGKPAVVHIEPDLWGYTQQRGDDPAAVPMKVGSLVPECTDLPSNVAGFGKCIIRLSRKIAPKVVIGLSASTFGAFTDGKSDPVRVGKYLDAVGANEADIIVVETLDRDAGCFEAAVDPNCQRAGDFYWDESNVRHPNFHDHLAWAKTIRQTVGRPLLWWQMPLGVPSSSPGSANQYRDNRVRYLFSHPSEFVAAGGIGAVFGKGKANQTTLATDRGQFKAAVTKYLAGPAAVP
jgi:hypothetical protein